VKVEREQVLRFRLAGQHLHARLGARQAPKAASACGIPEVPAGWGGLAGLAARVERVRPDGADGLACPYAMRGTPHLVAPKDLAVFTSALLAADDDELRAQLGRGADHLDKAGLEPLAAYHQVCAAVAEVVREGEPGITAFHAGLRPLLPEALLPWCRGCQSHHVHAMLWRLCGFAGVLARGAGQSRGAALVATGRPPATEPDAEAAGELVRRFLRCYGPATPGLLAEWAGIGRPQAKRLWQPVEDELAPVELGRTKAWILAADAPVLADPPAPEGVRVLGPNDPYLLQRDKATLFDDDAVRKKVRRPIGSPGVVLVDGALAASWRPSLSPKALGVKAEALGKLSTKTRKAVDAALAEHAPLRGRERADVTWT
jgi:hypothetical protein